MTWVVGNALQIEEKVRLPPSEKEIFEISLVGRHLLTQFGADQKTYHIELSRNADPLPNYQPGDCLAIYPQNQKKHIASLINSLSDGQEDVEIFEGRSGEKFPLIDYLSQRANLTTCSASLAIAMAEKLVPKTSEDFFFKQLCLETGQRNALLQFCRARTVVQLLQSYPKLITAQQLSDHLQPLLPRLYSIASAPHWASQTLDLTVSYVEIEGKWPRQGVCSHWLCQELEIGQSVRAHFHPHRDFHLPDDDNRPIIMVAAGTGIAPFRGFLQKRLTDNAKGENWLFMGQRRQKSDYYYRDFFKALSLSGKLKLDLAFSRDQAEKFYASDAMIRRGEEIVERIEKDAVIYVCGSIELGKSVHRALQLILEKHCGKDAKAAEDFLRKLRKEGRYRRDVY